MPPEPPGSVRVLPLAGPGALPREGLPEGEGGMKSGGRGRCGEAARMDERGKRKRLGVRGMLMKPERWFLCGSRGDLQRRAPAGSGPAGLAAGGWVLSGVGGTSAGTNYRRSVRG